MSIPHCDSNDSSCTSSNYNSSYSYTKSGDKAADVKHKVSFEREGTDAKGNTKVERKNVDFQTENNKVVRDRFEHYTVGKDDKGSYVHVKDPTGTVVGKEHIDSKLSVKGKADHIVSVINDKYPQKIGPHLRRTSDVASAIRPKDECTSIASIVKNLLDASNPSSTTRASETTRKKRRSRSALSKLRPRSSRKNVRAH